MSFGRRDPVRLPVRPGQELCTLALLPLSIRGTGCTVGLSIGGCLEAIHDELDHLFVALDSEVDRVLTPLAWLEQQLPKG
jgi:hypothetical protein